MGIHPTENESARDFHARVLDYVVRHEIPTIIREISESPRDPQIIYVEPERRLLDEKAEVEYEPDISVVYCDGPFWGTFFEFKSRYTESAPKLGEHNPMHELGSEVRMLREFIQYHRPAVESFFREMGVPEQVAKQMRFAAYGLYRTNKGNIKIYSPMEFL